MEGLSGGDGSFIVGLSILLNGELKGYFKGGKNLHLGDPLLPFLFVITMEILSRKHFLKFRDGLLDYLIQDPKAKISLFFVNGILVFVKSNNKSIFIIRRYLDWFSSVASMAINSRKTSLYCAWLSARDKSYIVDSLNMSLGSRHLESRYSS
uniref:Uncharacterized protein n=1 Tax=Kalanchoe fedtschenkoi TaxID=63787 RepID=A0A7N0UHV5_KALFE